MLTTAGSTRLTSGCGAASAKEHRHDRGGERETSPEKLARRRGDHRLELRLVVHIMTQLAIRRTPSKGMTSSPFLHPFFAR
jgi:hypothetical protein